MAYYDTVDTEWDGIETYRKYLALTQNAPNVVHLHGGECLINTWGDKLKARYVQTGHHGNNSFPTSFYDFVNPQSALFDAPQWLLDGETYTTKDLLNYFQNRGNPTYSYLTAPNVFEIL